MKQIGNTLAVLVASLVFAGLVVAGSKDDRGAPAGKETKNSKAKDWFLQTLLLVEDGDELIGDNRSGIIGRLEGTSVGKDPDDIRVFANVNGSPGAVVITHGAEWGENAGQYASDYRPSGADRQVWTLAVTSNRPNATVTLYWEGLNEISANDSGGYDWQLNNSSSVLKTLRLVDMETGEVTSATGKKGVMNSYTFNMNGAGERLFRWVQGDVLAEDLVLSSATSLRAFGPLAQAAQAQGALSVQGQVSGFPPPPSLENSNIHAKVAPPPSVTVREK